MSKRIEEKWLDYAWDVVSSTGSIAGHREECVGLGGACENEKCRPANLSLRLPGYIGSNYNTRRVMFVGAVHNGQALFTQDFRPVETATAKWSTTGRSSKADNEYLKEVRAGYDASMPLWGPWRNSFGAVLETLNIPVNGCVYTNVAKCWSKPRESATIPAGKQDDLLMEFCLLESDHPIKDLVQFLDPVQIYISARNVFVTVDKWSTWGTSKDRVWVFNSNTGELLQGNCDVRTLSDARAQYYSLMRHPPSTNS